MDKAAYKEQFAQEETAGWNAIDEQLKKVYGEVEPRHYGPCCTYSRRERTTGRINIYDSNNQAFTGI
jgi:hypothetical protein